MPALSDPITLVAILIGLGILFCIAVGVTQPGRERRIREARAGEAAELSDASRFPPEDFLVGAVETGLTVVTIHVKDVNDIPIGSFVYRRLPSFIELTVGDSQYVAQPVNGWRDVRLFGVGLDGNTGHELARYQGSRTRGGFQVFNMAGRELRVPGGWKSAIHRRYPIVEADRVIGLAMAPDRGSSLRFTLSMPRDIAPELRLFVFALLVRCLT